MKNNKKNIARSVLSIAIAMALVPATSYAGFKPFDIKGLPQTGAISGIRAGKASNGDVVITWQSGPNLYAQRISNKGVLDGNSLSIASNLSDTFFGDYSYISSGLAVKTDGSFVVGWPTSDGVQGVKVTGNSLGVPFTVSPDITSSVVALAKSDGYAIAWDSSLLNLAADDTPGVVEPINTFDSIAMDSGGDFFIAQVTNGYDYGYGETVSSLLVTKNNAPDSGILITGVGAYDFGSGKNKNKRISIHISEPVIAANALGEFVVVWSEFKLDTTRKPKKICYTPCEGQKICEDGFSYSINYTSTMNARRYNNLLQPKDLKPIVVTSLSYNNLVSPAAGNPSPINLRPSVLNADATFAGILNADTPFTVVLDADGDFTVAYNAIKLTSLSFQSDIFVKQFIHDKAHKLVAGAAIPISASSPKPKLAASHTLVNSRNVNPSVVVTDENTNAFMVFWRNDYGDLHKDNKNLVEVCDKYKTVKSSCGYSYRECVHYKNVPSTVIDNVSILKAKRYNTK